MTELFRRRDARARATSSPVVSTVESVLPWAGEQPDPQGGARPGQPADPAGTPAAARTAPAPPDDAADDDLDLHSGWERPTVGRLTALLVIGVIAVGTFIGGVLVQKSHDAGLASTGTGGAAARARAAAAAGGFGGFGGFGGAAPGGAGTDLAGATGGATSGAGGGTASGQAAPVVVGTVVAVKGTDLTVKNFAGASVVVHVAAGTPVTLPGLAPLAAGMTVSVTGTKAADGSVTATGVVARRAG